MFCLVGLSYWGAYMVKFRFDPLYFFMGAYAPTDLHIVSPLRLNDS